VNAFTDDTAIQKGYDPVVAAVYGDSNHMEITGAKYHHEIDQGYPIR